MSEEDQVPFDRVDSVTVYLWPDEKRAQIVLYEFDAETVDRDELGTWEFTDYPADDWESVLNHVGPWLNRHGLAYSDGEAAWDTTNPNAPTVTLYQYSGPGSPSRERT